MKVLIDTGSGPIDYTQYVADGSLSIEDSINVPTVINFILTPTNNAFAIPPRSSYVTVVSERYASGGGGYGSGKVVATGFISNSPSAEYLGLSPKLTNFGEQQLSYKVNATSDEWLLNCRAIPYIPAFVNRTEGEILAGIAETLAPGFFDVTSFVGSGDIVPYYQYDPSQTWSDVAKTFGDATRYRYKVINKQIYFQPFGDAFLGINYDERLPHAYWFPLELQSDVVTVPPVNDALVIGAVEPQANWENYFVGDGFTSQFRLLHQVFDGSTTLVLQDDWTEDQFQTQLWTVRDQYNIFNLDNNGQPLGALNIASTDSTAADILLPLGTDYILSQNGVELGGGLNLQHGQVEFVNACSGGIIGGLYEDTSLSLVGCIAGFGTFPQSASPSISITQVGVASGSNIVRMETYTQPSLQVGNVVRCSGFTSAGASFLNWSIGDPVQLSVISITQAQDAYGNTVYVISLLGDFLATPDGIFTDSGVIMAYAGDVFITSSGAGGIGWQPIYNGEFVGPVQYSLPNHQYVLQTWIGAEKWDRYERVYRNITGTSTYGGNALAASGTITWVSTDYDEGLYAITPEYLQQTIIPVNTQYTLQDLDLPAFAVYAPVNVQNQNYTLNYTAIYEPPQGVLYVRALTGASEYQISQLPPIQNALDPSITVVPAPTGAQGLKLPVLPDALGPEVHYMMGFGMAQQTATILANSDTNYLAFYNDDIPGVGARIRYQSWSAGESMARITDPIAIANEARVSGDSGVRSAIFTNLSPQPRTSSECELAAAAAIKDDEYPQFQGTYTIETVPYKFENLFNPGIYDYPVPGRFLNAYSPYRGIVEPDGVTAMPLMVNTARIQVTELREEVLQMSVDYGPDLYLEKILTAFLQRTDNLLTPSETVQPPNPIDLLQVGNYYLDTPDSAEIITIQNSSVTGNTVVIDLTNFQEFGASGVEIRRIDSGWGNSDSNQLIEVVTDRYVVLTRSSRDQTWYLRYKNGAQYSRFSKALRVVYPLIPSPPILKQVLTAPGVEAYDATALVLDFNGDVSDIYGLELRASALSGLNIYVLPSDPSDQIAYFSRQALPQTQPYTPNGNCVAIYSPVGNYTPPTAFQVGDIVLVDCFQDSSFSGLVLCTDDRDGYTSGPATYRPSSSYFDYNFSNPQYAYDGNPTTYSYGYAQTASVPHPAEAGAECTWLGFSGASGTNNVLNITSAAGAYCNGDGTAEVYVQYSLNGGSTWTTLYNIDLDFPVSTSSSRSQTTDSISLPDGQDISKIQVFADILCTNSMLAGGNYGFVRMYEINVTQGFASEPYTQFAFFENGDAIPTTNGQFIEGQSYNAGTAQLYYRGDFSTVVSGAIVGNTATLYTAQPHGYSTGQSVINGCAWTYPPPAGQSPIDGAPMCGQQTVSNVIDDYTFQFSLANYTGSSASGNMMTGATAPVPTAQIYGGDGGVIIQKPVFAPADLVIDLTQPDIAAALSVLESINQGNRVSGLNAYFFNLTWDYSNPLAIPTFEVPAITGVQVSPSSLNVTWGISQGNPIGSRVETFSPTTGLTQSRFTVDHPNNPQPLKQAPLPFSDVVNARTIKVTPFDALGDGIPVYINWSGTASGGIGVSNPYAYEIHSAVNSYCSSGQIIQRTVFDQTVTYTQNMSPSQAWIDDPPTSGDMVFSIQQFSYSNGTQDTGVEIGCLVFTPGTHVGTITTTGYNTFNLGDVMKTIGTSEMGNGVGISVTYSGTIGVV
jgi:hypothetical protein